ncbi:MAG: hypothetical protein JO341_02030 [Gammaproteobacteria bacterium]|nr:hypothetical protein [Gammaproteobacteria bacterium]MBV9619776.1 hypothetical protein [Gammaproteobacteria bacterium]
MSAQAPNFETSAATTSTARAARCGRQELPCRGPVPGLRVLIVDRGDGGLLTAHHLEERGHLARVLQDVRAAVHMGDSFRPHVCVVNTVTCRQAIDLAWQLRTAPWGRQCLLIAAPARDALEQYRALQAGFSHISPAPPETLLWLHGLRLGIAQAAA